MCIRSLRFEHFSPWDKVCGCVALRNYRQHILRDRRMFKVFFIAFREFWNNLFGRVQTLQQGVVLISSEGVKQPFMNAIAR